MEPALISFDCYGTLVRWPETLRSVFGAVLRDVEAAPAFHRDFSEFHVGYKRPPYRPYSEVLRLALAATMRKWNLDGVAQAQDLLLSSVRAIPPYDDVVPVLRSLSSRYRIAIVSNTEDALIEATVRGLGVACEVVTAEQARAYKPDHRLFACAFEKLQVAPERVLHIGAGWETDMVPAFELGLARVWINRRGERADASRPPTAELSSLHGLESLVPRLRPQASR